MKISRNTRGLTIVELMVAIVVLGMISSFTFSIYTNFFDATRDIQAGNLVYEEARFAMERVVKEIRNGTVDYEEYFNQSKLRNDFPDSYDYLRNETYADDYCAYSREFYDVGNDGEIGTLDDEPTGLRTKIDPVDGVTPIPPAIGRLDETGTIDEASPIQNDLFLININGDQRTFVKRIVKLDENGNEVGRLGLLKLDGKDFGVDHLNAFNPMLDNSPPDLNCSPDSGEGDGRIDTWICADGFPCEQDAFTNPDGCPGILHNIVYDPNSPDDSSFLDITPPSLDAPRQWKIPFADELGVAVLVLILAGAALLVLTIPMAAMRAAFNRWLWHVDRDLVAVETFQKMGRLATLAKLGPNSSQTPFEYADLLAGAMPEHSAELETITGAYVNSRFGRAAPPGLFDEAEILKARYRVYGALLDRVGLLRRLFRRN